MNRSARAAILAAASFALTAAALVLPATDAAAKVDKLWDVRSAICQSRVFDQNGGTVAAILIDMGEKHLSIRRPAL